MSEFKILYKLENRKIFNRYAARVNTTCPCILKIFSEENGEWTTAKNIKYFRMPKLSEFPLNLAIDSENNEMSDKEHSKPSFSKMFNYVIKYKRSLSPQNNCKHQIITSRYSLKYIFDTPYRMNKSDRNNWTLKVTKFGNIIYLVKSKDQKEATVNRRSRFFKFHQYCFTDFPNSEKLIDDNKQTFGIFRNTVDDFEILYSAEVDGIESEEKIQDLQNDEVLNNCKFVMVRLQSEKLLNPEWEYRKNQVFLSIWTQCYLGCVENIYLGFNDKNEFINEKMKQVKAQSFQNNQKWEPEVCKRFLRDVLCEIQKVMENIDCPYTVFEFKLDTDIRAIKYRVYEGKSENSFLDEEIIQYMQKN